MSKKNYKQMKKKRVKTIKIIKTFLVLPVLLVILGWTIYCGGVLSNAHGNLEEDPVGFKYYRSIEIKQGDTLWGIAQKYMTEEYSSPQEYIEEIKQLNGLTSNSLQESKHLLVAYYDTSFKE
ncbi:LysM peptidoglycan-binding domain-containing protein [Faecalimonas sp.]